MALGGSNVVLKVGPEFGFLPFFAPSLPAVSSSSELAGSRICLSGIRDESKWAVVYDVKSEGIVTFEVSP